LKVFLIYIRDKDFYNVLPEEFGNSQPGGKFKVMAFPPLGIQTLAPVLRQHGHEVLLFDTCHPQMKEIHIVQAALNENPDVIALSFLSTTTYLLVKNMARQLKTTMPDTPIIVGGPFASLNGINILKDCSYIDCVGGGEGEELFPDYLNNIDNLRVVQGLTWRSEDEVVQNPLRPIIKNLDQFPYPDRSSLPIEYIESMPLDVPVVLSLDRFCIMQTSRGCPFDCIYCDIPTLAQGKWRYRSPEHVLGEMQQLHDQGYKSIYITDDHFLLKKERIHAICQGIIERKFNFRWGCEGRVDSQAVIEEFPIMAQANCSMLAFGVEAGTQKILNRLKKRQNLDQVEYAINEAKKHGIDIAHGFFLVGSPDESESDMLQSFRFAARLKLDTFGFNRLCVYRGTPLWQEYLERGIIDDEKDWHKWFKCSDIDPTVLPSERVNRIRMKGYLRLFGYRILFRPIQTFKLIRKFSQYMKYSEILQLLWSPFRRKNLSRKPELPARLETEKLAATVTNTY
jgi:anaerobic magnesium-protoporphyrin IX monomethyl ester cyclase